MKLLQKSVVLAFCLLTPCAFSYEGAVLALEEPAEYLGGVPGLESKQAVEGKITVTTEEIVFRDSNRSREFDFKIDPAKVVRLTAGGVKRPGAYNKKRVMVIEYSEEKGKVKNPKRTGAASIRYGPKLKRSNKIEQAVESATGIRIETSKYSRKK